MGVGGQGVLYPHRPTPEAMFELIHRHRPDALLRRAHALRRDAAGEGGGEALRPLVAPPLRVGGGGAARGALPPLARALRRRDPRRHRHHRDPAHLPVEPPGAGAARARRACRCPATRRSSWTTTGRPVPAGEIGNLRVKGDSIMAYYWNQHEKTKDDALRPLDPDRRQVLPGRGRLLLVLRPRRRHAEGRRHLGVAGRGREHADRPSRGARGRRGRRTRTRTAREAEGLRRAEGRPRGRAAPSRASSRPS